MIKKRVALRIGNNDAAHKPRVFVCRAENAGCRHPRDDQTDGTNALVAAFDKLNEPLIH